jgi:hypothetical protein
MVFLRYSIGIGRENPLSKKGHKKHKNQEPTNDSHNPTYRYEIEWPPIYRVRVEPKADDEKKYSDEQSYKGRQLKISKMLNWITGLAAIVGLCGLAYLRGQLGAMIESNKINREALVSVQRAFVNIGKNMQENQVIIPGQAEVKTWEFRPKLGNSGVTPTKNARNHANFLPLNEMFPENFQFFDIGQQSPEVPFILGPKEDTTGALLEVPFDRVKDVRDKKAKLFFYGWVIYEDIFPETPKHISMFCIELVDVRGELKPNTPYALAWGLCPRHNCADDECKGEPYGTPTKIWPNQ